MMRPLNLDPQVYLRNDYVVIDFETTNRDFGSPANKYNRIVLACWYLGPEHPSVGESRKGGVHSHWGTEFDQEQLTRDVLDSGFVVAFNAKFECGWLKRCGVDLRDLIVYDPMLGEYVLYGNTKPAGGYSLDATLERYGIPGKMRYVSALIDAGVCPSDAPKSDLERYCICDVNRTHSLFLRQRRKIFRHRTERVLYGRCLQSPMLADIESRGTQLDSERVRVEFTDTAREYSRLEGLLQDFTGPVNWDSPKQVTELLYDKLGFEEARDYRGNVLRTKKGGRSASADVVNLLKSRTSGQRKFKDLWGQLAPLKKQVSILESMKGACDEDSGLIFASFNQAVTQNHRLSSSGGKWGFQFQNIPRSLKSVFRARERGWQVFEGDCPQLEFRVGAELGRDPVAKADVLARADVHSLTSAVTGFSRQDSKPHTFKPLYGGRSGPPRLRAYYDAFRKRYSAIYDTQMGWVYSVLEHKSLTTPTGLVFYWPDTEVTRSGFITNTPAIFNYPISMLATADISQLSLLLFWHSLRGMDTFICNTIHDSGVGESPLEELDKVRSLMVQSYTQDIYETLSRLYDIHFDMPLGLGFKSDTWWGTGEEFKFEPETRFAFTSKTKTEIKL